MTKRVAVFVSLAFGLAFAVALQAEDKKVEALCPVSGKAIDESAFVDYKGGKVYFCCMNCPKAFAKNPEKFAVKANHQLVVTGQAVEVKCPIAGRPLNPETAIDVQGVKVAFCCNNCKGKASKAEGDEQLNLIFSDKAFDKAFEVKKAEGETK